MTTTRQATTRTIVGTHYTQADSWDRNQSADFAAALAYSPVDYNALMYLHRLGYDCSQARVVRSKASAR